MEIDIEIDGLTNCLVERATGQEKDTQYRLISKTITKAEAENLKIAGWLFDWSIPHSNGYEVYELLLKDTNERQGLIALKHIRNQLYTHVDVVESSPSNRGSHGIYQGVGAHLFAIACKLSWDVGNEGFVQFKAKTNLVEHYRETLNAQNIDDQNMFIDSYSAINLIKKYFSEEA
ncbi:hypothetical protein [Treponema succinifaciens]|uniref:Uncharacterized protein n=1 Tax=Treponema succinifaciens (strain ATCC 33096 / DSM 2489 / 6091) TaxID=869209 RepID=F2NYN7_TRES6|nr:hypothetical protein [Treponema succinifaciens]AEB15536.1 hypothetical protein Tresu_2679 [Treponema succinifaciens DSM 2489]